MIEERIGEVRVRVRTDLSDATEIRREADRIVRAVLERCAAILEERAPGRVVLIRRLPLRWRLDESVFEDEMQVEELAVAAADAIERIAIPSSLDPPPSYEGAILFDDEAHLCASHLLALARGGPAWYHAGLEEPEAGDPLVALAAPERRQIAHAVLVRLAREHVLAEAIAARPAAAVSAFAAALGFDDRRASTQEDESRFTEAASAIVELADMSSRWPPLVPAALLLALRVHAAVLLDTVLEATAAVALAEAALERSPATIAAPPEFAKTRDEPQEGRRIETVDGSAGESIPEESGEIVSTRCGGVFYLLDRVQELDLGESLWKACLPEGTLFAAAMSALLGPRFAADPAPALFGGVETAVTCPDVTPEQHGEIAIATCAALASALPRRGLASIPRACVELVRHSAGRLLVAAAEGFPFAFFAWPAETPEMLRAGLDAFLGSWPHRGALTAAPALASLDTSGRLRLASVGMRTSFLLPEAPSVAAAAVLALTAGAPSTLIAARLDEAIPFTVEDFVARRLARPARVRMSEDRMDVIFHADDLDLDLRRAGLDRDPGWLPWLERTVKFIFEKLEEVEDDRP